MSLTNSILIFHCRYLRSSSSNSNRSVFDNAMAKFAAVKDCLTLIGFSKDVSMYVRIPDYLKGAWSDG